MSIETLLIILLIGAIAGWLAGQIVQGTGFGLIADIVIGIIGAFIGNWLLPRLGLHLGVGIVAAIIAATIGAVVLFSVSSEEVGVCFPEEAEVEAGASVSRRPRFLFLLFRWCLLSAHCWHTTQALEFHSSLQHALSMCSLLPTWYFLLASCFEAFELVFMSAFGPKRTSTSALHMSAFGGKADIAPDV
jgi:uncharacterized membrane protein YeaQ/YmgE (transglycosylase-associated protein family)